MTITDLIDKLANIPLDTEVYVLVEEGPTIDAPICKTNPWLARISKMPIKDVTIDSDGKVFLIIDKLS